MQLQLLESHSASLWKLALSGEVSIKVRARTISRYEAPNRSKEPHFNLIRSLARLVKSENFPQVFYIKYEGEISQPSTDLSRSNLNKI